MLMALTFSAKTSAGLCDHLIPVLLLRLLVQRLVYRDSWTSWKRVNMLGVGTHGTIK